MRSFSFLSSRLILVPSALQSHALLPFRLTSSPSALQSHALLPFRPTSSSSTPPVTCPFTFPSHIILVSPSSHIPLYHSVSRHPRQPLQSHALLPFRLTSSPSAHPVTRPCTIPSHIILVNPSSHTPLYHSVPPLRFFSPLS